MCEIISGMISRLCLCCRCDTRTQFDNIGYIIYKWQGHAVSKPQVFAETNTERCTANTQCALILPFLFLLHLLKRTGMTSVSLMLLFTEGNSSLLAMYTQQLPVLPCTLPDISWPSLNKAAPSFQPAAELMRWAADKPADGSQLALIGSGAVDEFLMHSGSLLLRKHKQVGLSKYCHLRR